MPLDFIIISVIFIFCLFYVRISVRNLFLFLGLIFIIVSYFNLNLQLFGVNFNVSVILGLFCWVIFICFSSTDIRFKYVIESVIYMLILYTFINLFGVEFNSFFNVVPVVAISVLISSIIGRTLNESICIFTMGNIGCEILNIIFLLKNLNMASVFCREFVICCIIGTIIVMCLYWFKTLFRVKYEKVS